MVNPVCVKCGREMRCIKNGFLIFHLYEKPDPGSVVEKRGNWTIINTDRLISPEHYLIPRIDFVVYGDKYRCESCGVEVVTDFGEGMVDHQYPQEWLKKQVEMAKEKVEIKRRKYP